MGTSACKLKVTNLAKNFTLHTLGGVRVHGFSGINFTLEQGQLLALSGPSGAGKSSILKTIYRSYQATSGSAMFWRRDGSQVDLASCSETRVLDLRRREIGFVTQFLKILPRVSALDTVARPLVEIGLEKNVAKAKAERLLRRLGIRPELFQLSPLTFSGGEQQRINIARGIIAPKELLLLDEPTASLDEKSCDTVLDLLDELKKQGIAMIAIFHDQKKIDRIADLCVPVKREQ